MQLFVKFGKVLKTAVNDNHHSSSQSITYQQSEMQLRILYNRSRTTLDDSISDITVRIRCGPKFLVPETAWYRS